MGKIRNQGAAMLLKLLDKSIKEPSWLWFTDWKVFRKSFGWFQHKKEQDYTDSDEEEFGLGFLAAKSAYSHAISSQCPKCGAISGRSCQTPRRKTAKTHKARMSIDWGLAIAESKEE